MKRKFLCILIMILIFQPVWISQAKYYEQLQPIKVEGIIAEPIVNVEPITQNTITQTIDQTSHIESYQFSVKNYIVSRLGTRVNQVDMQYCIKIVTEKENFPVRCVLREIGTEENLLKEKDTTSMYIMPKDIEYDKQYELLVLWENKDIHLADTSQIQVVVNATQIK